MALQWADFPSGQPGLYGTSTARMLDGTPWVAIPGGGGGIIADPDTTSFPSGLVLRPSSGSSGPADGTRLAIDTPHQKVGVACRVRFPSLPAGSTTPVIFLNSSSNTPRYGFGVRPNGGIEINVSGSTSGSWGTLATADFPIVLANSWNHIEIVGDVVTGQVDLYVNGELKLSHTDAAPPGSTIGIVSFPTAQPGGSDTTRYLKDIVVYNGAGAQFNGVQGTVGVTDLRPVSDSSIGGWLTSTGSTGWDLIDENTPDDADYIYSAEPPTAPSVFNMSDLDPDIVSVRGLLMIMRGLNNDSGDGIVQMGISPDGGTNTDLGATHALTSTARYRFDTSELSPATGTPWTPTEVNALTLQFNRTT